MVHSYEESSDCTASWSQDSQFDSLSVISDINDSFSVLRHGDIHTSLHLANVAHDETLLLKHLCTCAEKTLRWCFIHSKAIMAPGPPATTNSFGFIATSSIESPLFRPSTSLDVEDLQQWAFQAHLMVKSTNVYNYKNARIRVPTELYIDHWRALCGNYYDQKILEYLEFGFPLCLDRSKFVFNGNCDNHPSATQFPSDVTAYFNKEVKHKAIVGPCTNIPFPTHFSPMLTRFKQDDTRRVIVNLSHPKGQSVNDCINDGVYDGVTFTLKYPTVDQIVQKIQDLDSDVLLSKIDISRAFRNLRVDPLDYDALGLHWNGQSYLDISVPMGMKVGSALCQRTTDILRHVMAFLDVCVYNYVDDVICVHRRHNATQEFRTLYSLFEFLGLPINPKKVCPPSRSLTCMGIDVNVDTGSLTIPLEKCAQTLHMCKDIRNRKFISKKMLQSLLGKLIYLHRCIPPARIFVNRLLNTLRSGLTRIKVTKEMIKDITWFIQFLNHFNGTVMFPQFRPQVQVHVDACLTGMGAIWDSNVYAASRNVWATRGASITQLEMCNVLLALRVFAKVWSKKCVIFNIDNQAVVYSLKYGRIKDPYMQSVARSVWLVAAAHDINLQYNHVPGVKNVEADALSRAFDPSCDLEKLNQLRYCKWWPVNGFWCYPNVFS